MAEAKARRGTTSARKRSSRRKPAEEAEAARMPVCTVAFCPICTAMGAMQEIRPEVVQHLLAAGREMLLAARAFVDARVETVERSARLEKIDIA